MIIQTKQPLFAGADEKAAVKTADGIIAQAVKCGASDIHIEPEEDVVRGGAVDEAGYAGGGVAH